jgi:predicted HTH domain antitoxin
MHPRRKPKEVYVAHQLSIEYGDDVLASAAMPKEEFDAEAKLLLAAKLYELGRLSSGQAARLCGKGRVDFLLSLPRVGVSISNLRPEDAEAELEFLRNG